MTATCNQAKDAPHGIAAILVDDTLMTGNKHFAKAEELMHSNFDMGQTQTVSSGSQIKFGGVQIGRDPDDTLRISQEAYITYSNFRSKGLRVSTVFKDEQTVFKSTSTATTTWLLVGTMDVPLGEDTDLLPPQSMTDYRSVVGTIGYASPEFRPDLAW
jgi:hypothetical protein